MENKKGNEVTLVAGVINATGKMLYWKCDFEINIGDYAIVENMNGYDLVEIVGLVETDEEHINKLIGNKINKKVSCVVFKEELEGLKDNA